VIGDGEDVLVAAAAQVHDHQVVLGQLGRELPDVGERVRGLECGNDAFELGAELEGVERLFIGATWITRRSPS
jgi:hypothetical protein